MSWIVIFWSQNHQKGTPNHHHATDHRAHCNGLPPFAVARHRQEQVNFSSARQTKKRTHVNIMEITALGLAGYILLFFSPARHKIQSIIDPKATLQCNSSRNYFSPLPPFKFNIQAHKIVILTGQGFFIHVQSNNNNTPKSKHT